MAQAGKLDRSVGFYGLMFLSLGSIIGSGWLLGALNAAEAAGPASILSWLLAAAMLSLLALTYAELGATFPVAGGPGRFPAYSHGPIVGFTAGWAGWLQAVFVAPIEVLAALTYINSVDWVNQHHPLLNDGLLNGTGMIAALLMMGLFTAINLAGAKFMSESNTWVVIWKTLVPVAACVVVGATQFDTGNFTRGGGFMPNGFHGVFAALTGGVVFALQGFEQAVMLAGEARDPKRDLAKAVITAMAIGAVLYSTLQLVLLGALEPANIEHGWLKPLGGSASAYGAWYSLALALGIGWLAKTLLVDAIISPAGTGVVYVGAAARLSYALGEESGIKKLSSTNSKGVPVFSIVVSAIVGCIAFGPFRSWKDLVGVITGATAIMYSFAPLSLAALHKLAPDRKRTYRVPMPKILLPAAFCSANLIVYWGGFEATWKLALAMIVGIGVFAGIRGKRQGVRNAVWMVLWFAGQIGLGALGRYGGGYEILPAWVDIACVCAFAIFIFQLSLHLTVTAAESAAEIERDAHQLESA